MDATVTCAWCGALRLREFTVRVDGPHRVCRERVGCDNRRAKPKVVRHRTVTLTALGQQVAEALG